VQDQPATNCIWFLLLKTAKLLRKDKKMNTRRKKLGNILVYWILKNHPEMGIIEAFEHAIAIANRVFPNDNHI
jgi:hypothetical protein